jgi:hypothetical protein
MGKKHNQAATGAPALQQLDSPAANIAISVASHKLMHHKKYSCFICTS